MTIEQTREKIMSDDDFVLAEVNKVQYLYGLQRVIRSGLTRTESIKTESVADHVYALGVLATYFSKIEELPELNWSRVQALITWHDIDEIETGDTPGFLKTTTTLQDEVAALQKTITQAPTVLQYDIASVIDEYKKQETIEARFVKALDKIDPCFYLLNENGKEVFRVSPATKEQHCRIKEPYVRHFPYINRFYEVTLVVFERDGYFKNDL
jgi:putative hydrolase of HD superfamily